MGSTMSKTLHGILFALLASLVGIASGIQVRGMAADSLDTPVCYEAVFLNDSAATVQVERLESALPSSGAYAGLAAGSEVTSEAQQIGGHLVWEGPFELLPAGELTLRYWLAPTMPTTQLPSLEIVAAAAGGVDVRAIAQPGCPVPVSVPVPEEAASLEAVTVERAAETPVLEPGDEPTIASEVTFTSTVFIPLLLRNYQAFVPTPVLFVDKVASPTAVNTGELVTYDVKISNPDPYEGTVSVISDALPAGFTFQQMDPGSDVIDDPLGSTGTITWPGPFIIPPESEIHLIYQVRTGGLGTWNNSVLVQDAGGNVYGPAESVVTTFLEETFDTDVPPEWTPFVNYPGLSAVLWFWKGGEDWGRYDFDPYALGSNYKYWGLSMYEAQQAEASTDYRIEATIRTGRHTKNPLTGIWFRGQHQLRTDLQGGDVTGYYLVLKEKDNTVRLGKIRTADRRFDAVDWVPISAVGSRGCR
jgi:uncharacterized repeat protein (TIGR01451 family)